MRISEIVVRRQVARLVDLEYAASFDRVGTSTDHEVEVFPRDRIWASNIINPAESPPCILRMFSVQRRQKFIVSRKITVQARKQIR